jgi:hypothetical protein
LTLQERIDELVPLAVAEDRKQPRRVSGEMVPTTHGRVLQLETELGHTRAALKEALALVEVLREALSGREPTGPFDDPAAHDYALDVINEMRVRKAGW